MLKKNLSAIFVIHVAVTLAAACGVPSSVSGFVTAGFVPVRNARVSVGIVEPNGVVVPVGTAYTGVFGHYSVGIGPCAAPYVITVTHGRHAFARQAFFYDAGGMPVFLNFDSEGK